MRTGTSFFVCGLLLWSCFSKAEICEDEIAHFASMGLHYIPKTSPRNSNFVYQDIPGANGVLAIEKADADRWKLDISSNANGFSFAARGMAFGLIASFDQTGKCLNSVAFEYDVFGNKLPANVNNISLQFNYNFATCQKVEQILNRFKIRVDVSSGARVADDLKKNHFTDYNNLQSLAKSAVENKFYKISEPSVETLVTKCMLQIENRKTLEHPLLKPGFSESR